MERTESFGKPCCFIMPGAEIFDGLTAALHPCRSSHRISDFTETCQITSQEFLVLTGLNKTQLKSVASMRNVNYKKKIE